MSEGGRSRWEDAADTRDEGREHESRRERDREAAAAPDRQMVRAASWSEGRVFRARVPAAAAVVKESASPFPGEQEAQRDAGREVSPNQRDDLTRQMVSERVCASEQASVCVCVCCLPALREHSTTRRTTTAAAAAAAAAATTTTTLSPSLTLISLSLSPRDFLPPFPPPLRPRRPSVHVRLPSSPAHLPRATLIRQLEPRAQAREEREPAFPATPASEEDQTQE